MEIPGLRWAIADAVTSLTICGHYKCGRKSSSVDGMIAANYSSVFGWKMSDIGGGHVRASKICVLLAACGARSPGRIVELFL